MARNDPKRGGWPDPWGGRLSVDFESDDDQDPDPPRRSIMARLALTFGLIWAGLAGAAISYSWISDFPDAANLLVYNPGKDITLLDNEGRTIARRGHNQGQVVKLAELPPHVGNAFVAVEDRRFRHHFGIDPWGLGRAMAVNIAARSFVQGGSTITQQLAKNLFLKPERTLKRKLDEAILALYLEYRYTKDEILTLYLNRVYFGAGVYGVEAASDRFFSKTAAELTLTEAAMLAGSVKAPSRYNPAASPEAALARAGLVLGLMAEQSYIGQAQREKAATAKPKIASRSATPGVGYFVDYAVALVPGFAANATERLIVDTTLDLDFQKEAERALETGLAKDGKTLAATQGALVSMALDGAVRALVGGRDYDESQFNRAIDARRQPGSAFKPFVYLAALEFGHRPSDQVVDEPVAIGDWQPENYEGSYAGAMTLAHALARSSNSASVQLTNEVGPDAVARVAHRLGIAGELQVVPSLALGTSEVTPIDLTAGYAAFANGGEGVIPYAIVRIRTETGRVLYERRSSGLGRVIEPRHEADMVAMMRGTVTEGTGRQAGLGTRPVAGKTGTSQAYRDAWFVGFTATHVTGVWIGNDAGTPMKGATGGGLPARIFKAYMLKAEEGLPIIPLIGTGMAPSEERAIASAEPPLFDALLERPRAQAAPVLDAAIALPPIPIQRPTRADVVVESTVAAPQEEVVAGSQQELVPGGQQVIGSPRTAAAGGDAGKVPVERTDAELIDAFEALLNKLF
jgi:penicillin-binding protein 1A